MNVNFTGNIGKDAEVRTTKSGDVCSFSVAVRQGISRDAPTEWMRCSIWGKQGNALEQYLTKGAKVFVSGELVIGSYEGKPQFNVRVNEIDPFCGGNRDKSEQSSAPARQSAPAYADEDLDDSCPF